MLSKKQMLVTAVAMITGSVLINLLWIVSKCYREGKTGMPLSLFLMYLLVVATGLAAIFWRHQKINSSRSLTICNCVATANFCVSITGAVFMYFDNGNRLTMKFIPLLLPLFVGVLIFEKFFFRVSRENNIN